MVPHSHKHQPSYSDDAQRLLTADPAVAQSPNPHPPHWPSAHQPPHLVTHAANLGLQLDNVLLATDGEGRACVKVCDFGYSKSQTECNTRCGTPEYMAPEVTPCCCRVLAWGCCPMSRTCSCLCCASHGGRRMSSHLPRCDDPHVCRGTLLTSSSKLCRRPLSLAQPGKDSCAR